MLSRFTPFWGRSLTDYKKMFSLDDGTPATSILSVADGPSTFNAESRDAGVDVLSVDPHYALDREAMEIEFENSYAANREYFYAHPELFSFTGDEQIETLLTTRRQVFEEFLRDFELHPQHYIAAKLPSLGLPSNSFELCLCANLLFLFDDLFDLQFHLDSILEMLRIAPTVKIFPLYGRSQLPTSPLLGPVLEALREKNISYTLQPTTYQVWQGESAFLVVRRSTGEFQKEAT